MSRLTIASKLADRLGYKSEATFARAFKRVSGTPPGAVKHRGETRTATSGGVAPAMVGS